MSKLLTDYQKQTPAVRLYRWLRYRPIGFVCGCVGLLNWIIVWRCLRFEIEWPDGFVQRDSWLKTAKYVWRKWDRSWMYMGRTYRMQEVLDSWKAKEQPA